MIKFIFAMAFLQVSAALALVTPPVPTQYQYPSLVCGTPLPPLSSTMQTSLNTLYTQCLTQNCNQPGSYSGDLVKKLAQAIFSKPEAAVANNSYTIFCAFFGKQALNYVNCAYKLSADLDSPAKDACSASLPSTSPTPIFGPNRAAFTLEQRVVGQIQELIFNGPGRFAGIIEGFAKNKFVQSLNCNSLTRTHSVPAHTRTQPDDTASETVPVHHPKQHHHTHTDDATASLSAELSESQTSGSLSRSLTEPPPTTASASKSKTPSSIIANFGFGAPEWLEYFGAEVSPVPALPWNISAIMNAPCPIWGNSTNNITVIDTHMLVLIPQAVNGTNFTLNMLGQIVQAPRKGNATQIDVANSWGAALTQYGPQPAPDSHWVLMTKQVLPGSTSLTYQQQVEFVANVTQRTGEDYAVPNLLDAVAAVLIERVWRGILLFSAGPTARLQESMQQGCLSYPYCRTSLNSFTASGFIIGGAITNDYDWNDNAFPGIGVAAIRTFTNFTMDFPMTHTIATTGVDPGQGLGPKDVSALTWQLNRKGASTMNWSDAQSYCSSLGGPWRLPTIWELHELYSQKGVLGIDLDPVYYWSSSPLTGSPGHAWLIDFTNGNVNGNGTGNNLVTGSSFSARCVY